MGIGFIKLPCMGGRKKNRKNKSTRELDPTYTPPPTPVDLDESITDVDVDIVPVPSKEGQVTPEVNSTGPTEFTAVDENEHPLMKIDLEDPILLPEPEFGRHAALGFGEIGVSLPYYKSAFRCRRASTITLRPAFSNLSLYGVEEPETFVEDLEINEHKEECKAKDINFITTTVCIEPEPGPSRLVQVLPPRQLSIISMSPSELDSEIPCYSSGDPLETLMVSWQQDAVPTGSSSNLNRASAQTCLHNKETELEQSAEADPAVNQGNSGVVDEPEMSSVPTQSKVTGSSSSGGDEYHTSFDTSVFLLSNTPA